jgi:hypothetical protein
MQQLLHCEECNPGNDTAWNTNSDYSTLVSSAEQFFSACSCPNSLALSVVAWVAAVRYSGISATSNQAPMFSPCKDTFSLMNSPTFVMNLRRFVMNSTCTSVYASTSSDMPSSSLDMHHTTEEAAFISKARLPARNYSIAQAFYGLHFPIPATSLSKCRHRRELECPESSHLPARYYPIPFVWCPSLNPIPFQ